MIQMQTRLVVADNTGAKEAMMIRRLGQHSRTAAVGDVIVVAIKSSTPDAAVKKGTVAKAVIVRSKAPIRRSDGSYLRFDSNAVVILDGNGNPKGTRIFGPVARELRGKNFELHFLDDAEYAAFEKQLFQANTSAVVAVSKKERYVQSVLSPNSCLYYNDVLNPSSDLNIAELTNALTQHPQSVVSLQLIPTSYTQQELFGIEQGRNFICY